METTYKVITLGSYSVGKTCILLKATEENFVFPQAYVCTIGVDFKSKSLSCDGHNFKLMIWDTAGQERFHHINRYYYNNCHAAILVYDITSIDSFEKISYFFEDFNKTSDGNIGYVLVGNKKDLAERKVSYEQGKKVADKMNIPFIECSAITGENIEDIFELVLSEIRNKEIEPDPSKNLYIVKTVKKQKKCCE